MAKARNNRGKPPSREKYERSHPTVSARLPTEKRDKLLSVLQRLGLSLRSLLISIADELEIKLKPLDEARRDGYREGYEKARSMFAVTYPCRKCSGPVAITSQQSKAAVSKFMTEHGAGHAECPKKANP
jgi:hypothetical protein